MINMYSKNLGQVTKDGSFFLPSEEEVIGVEHLLVEPKYDFYDVLGFSTFSQNTCSKINEYSTVDYLSSNTCEDAKDSYLDPRGRANVEFPNGIFGRSDATAHRRKNNISDVCEDYLLDNEFVDEGCDLNSRDLGVKSKYMVPSRAHCDAEMPELALEPVIANMTKPFGNVFERETAVRDDHSLQKNFSTVSDDFLEPFDENEVSPTNDQCQKFLSSSYAHVFTNFRRKPRLQHGKRANHNGTVSFKASSSEVREKGQLLSARKRLRRPTRRYIEELMEQNIKYQKKRCDVSGRCSKDKVPNNRVCRQLREKRSSTELSIHQKEPSGRACIQVPFGQPLDIEPLKIKEPELEYVDDSELLSLSSSSSSDSDTESVSMESHDDMSDDDSSGGSKTKKNNSPRKHHSFWSLSEVLKLVEGVKMYGVGRWTDIKRQHFDSSGNRTPVDLKDKWRNLLRASCSMSYGKREVGAKKKHPSQAMIPQSVLDQVRQLAAVYPYPRQLKTRSSVASPISARPKSRNGSSSSSSLIHLPAAVRV